MALCTVFCLGSDYAGARFLKSRRQAVQQEMARWQGAHNAQNVNDMDPAVKRLRESGNYKPDSSIL